MLSVANAFKISDHQCNPHVRGGEAACSFVHMNRVGPLIAPPSSSDLSEASKRLLPWLVAVAFFMESLDTTILNTAVPAISSALGVAPLSMKAVLASYTVDPKSHR